MARLIDVDKLISNLGGVVESGMAGNKTKAVLKFAIQIADAQPTVDAIPVVRCKNCFYYGEHTNYIKGKFCIKHSHLNDDFMFHCGEDDYCIWGERKTDEID